MTVKIEETTITPALAAKLLLANTQNRLISPRRVNAMAECMSSGQWLNDAAPYRLAADGRLLDGQHRLKAIIQSGISVPGIIVRGVDADSQMVMDTGRPRSFGDHLRMMGEANVSNAAAAARLLYHYRSGAVAAGVHGSVAVGTPILWKFFCDNRDSIREGLAAVRELRSHLGIIYSVGVVLYVVTDEIDSVDRTEFFAQLAKRRIPVPPVLQFTKLLDNRQRMPAGWLEQRIQLGLAIKTWNRFRSGDNSSQLLAFKRTEGFPQPV